MIWIDFAPGAYGHFIEYACNTLIAGVDLPLPFTEQGNSHNIQLEYQDHHFKSKHCSITGLEAYQPVDLQNQSVIQIKHTENDLLVLLMGMYERTPFNLNPDQLHIDTYHKLTQEPVEASRILLLEHINNHYKQVKESYDAVKDPSWSDVRSMSDYNKLPQHIKDECENVHQLYFVEISPDHPDCPRNILRDYYTNRFKNPDVYLKFNTMFHYPDAADVYVLPFTDILKKDKLLSHLNNISEWQGYDVSIDNDKFNNIYNEFISRQPYRNAKEKCDSIIERLNNRAIFEFEPLHIFEESYIIAQLNIPFPFDQQEWFKNSQEVYDLL